jgi:alkanesulfonate monooxygenase SsuD/methylene tetrahydromethanopterin reductase-like flavin-dependent oxidoreductase (luciferase family)
VGRGISPVEVGFYGIDFDTGPEQFREAFEVIRLGLAEEALTYHGRFYDFERVPIPMKPLQRPHPPIWYGIAHAESLPWCAAHAANIVSLRPAAEVRQIIDLYREEWRRLGRSEDALPLMGVNRHMVLAESEREAREVAARAYRPWRRHMEFLWEKYGVPFPLKAALPDEFEALQERGHAIAGTPAQVRDYIAGEAEEAGVNYFVCDFAFGSIGLEEALRSVELFARDVMPAFA